VRLPRALGAVVSGTMDSLRSRVFLAGATSVGTGVRIFGRPRVSCEGELVVGPGVVIVSSPAPVQLLVAPGARLVIGAGTVIESGATIRARRGVVIGSEARVGVGCVIDDDGPVPAEIAVHDRAWLEDGVILLAGAQIAARSIVPRGTLAGATSIQTGTVAHDDPSRAIEDRIRGVIGRVVPGASQAERGVDLRLFKGWDSLAALRVLVALEKEFSVTLPYDLFTHKPRLESVTPLLLATARHEGAR
jgi:acyl carrier protein